MIDLRQILIGEPVNLRYIKRFSVCPRVHEESVAEHSYYVAFFSMMLAEDLMKNTGIKIDLGKLLSRALIHDIDEVFSGDFIRMFKHNNVEVEESINRTSQHLMEGFTSKYPAGQNLLKYWKEGKADDIEGKLLAFADFLSVLSYVWQEIMAGNVIMFRHLEELGKFCGTFAQEKYSFIKDYTTQTENMVKELSSFDRGGWNAK